MASPKQFTTALREWSEVFMSRTMHEWFRFVKSSGLSMPQFSTLMRLYYHGGCGMSEMGAHLDVTAAATSQMVERLVHAGLIERVEDPSDRRAKQLTISAKGRALVEKGIEARNRWWEYLPAALNAGQRATVVEALNSLAEAARALDTSDTKTPT